MSEGELCQKCQKGHLYEKASVDELERELEREKVRETASATDLVCDVCGHVRKNIGRTQYEDTPVSDSVTATKVRAEPEEKAFTCHCGASFKTDQDLHDHYREHTD